MTCERGICPIASRRLGFMDSVKLLFCNLLHVLQFTILVGLFLEVFFMNFIVCHSAYIVGLMHGFVCCRINYGAAVFNVFCMSTSYHQCLNCEKNLLGG